ncbi:MAG TPA: insulinase family protein, partial [Candidatus Polarisedimenticolia bacterium]|nr:insulinase family protein [Candidatus Polarisedimenticolia bacterium]
MKTRKDRSIGSMGRMAALPFALLMALRAAFAAPGVPEVRTLANGIELVILEDHAVPLVAASLWVHAGSKQEIETSAGYAHFLEHLIQRGTDTVGAFEYQRLAQRWGGSMIVRSNYDRMQVTASGVPAALPDLIDALAGMAFHAALKDSEIDQELGTLNQEIRNYYDEPVSVAFLETMRATFAGHSYHVPMLGNFRTLGTLKHDPLASFYRNLYVPNNMVLVVAGDLDPKRAASQVEAAFGKESRSPTLAPQPGSPTAFTGHADIEKRLNLKETWVNLSFAGPAYRSQDRPAFEIIARALGEASGAPVQAALLRAKAGSAVQVSAYGLEDACMLYVALQPSTPQLSYQAAGAALEAIVGFKARGLKEADLRGLVDRVLLEERLQAQDLAQRAGRLGEAGLFGGIRYYWDLPDVYRRLTPAEVARVAAKYLVSDNLKLVLILPKETPPLSDQSKEEFHKVLDRLGASPEGADHDLGRIRYPPSDASMAAPAAWGNPRDASGLRPPERTVLGNGLTVVVQDDHREPLAAVALALPAGSGDDPPGKEGLASLAGRLIASAASASVRSASAGPGGRGPLVPPEIQVSRDLIEIRVLTPPEGLRTALTFLADAIRRPAIDDAGIAAARRSNLDALDRSAEDPGYVALELFHEKVYADHPYGHPAPGTAAGLGSLTREDLAAFFSRNIRPSKTVVAVAGDVGSSEAVRIIKDLLGDWKEAASGGPPAVAETSASKAGATAHARAGEFTRSLRVAQSRVIIGVPGVPIGSPDFERLRMIGTALTLRAFEELVFARRAAFSATTIPEGLRSGGSLALELVVPPQKRQEAIFDLNHLIRQIALEGLKADEIAVLGRVQAGREAASIQSVQSLASTLAYREVSGLGALSYRDALSDPTPADPERLRELASRYLR